MIRRYDSIAAIAEHYRALAAHMPDSRPLGWYGGETQDDTLRRALTGDTALVAEAEALIDQLTLSLETPRLAWERAPAGAFCAVPDFLAGLPTPMRRRAASPDDRAPITILANIVSSEGIPASALAKRGAVILALTLALSRIRPVTLEILATLDGTRDGSGETVFLAPINTTPLDLATACYVLTSAGFPRRLLYDLGRSLNGFTGAWPYRAGFNFANPQPYYDSLRERLGLQANQTLVIDAARLGDPLLSAPVAWLNAQLARFANAES